MDQSRWAPRVEEPAQNTKPRRPAQNQVQIFENRTSAPSIAEAYPSGLDGAVDEFAQTRAPDDLFSDDFEPVGAEYVQEIPFVPEQTSPQAPAPIASSTRGKSHKAPRPTTSQVDGAERNSNGPDASKKGYVKGNRLGTGGVQKDKLTEEQLDARMEAIRLKNESLLAAHARAEADAASFQQREADAVVKRKQERQEHHQLMGEREKNRQRKMKALGGREWDAEKDSDPQALPARDGQFRRGAHGGIASSTRATVGDAAAAIDVDRSTSTGTRGNSRGDSSHGRGSFQSRGRGRGRGTESREAQKSVDKSQPLPASSDFPTLPQAATPPAASSATAKADDSGNTHATSKDEVKPVGSGAAGKTSWAEEMDDASPSVSTGPSVPTSTAVPAN